jgi:4-hydroxy-tetrahydrodipicolinate reductase
VKVTAHLEDAIEGAQVLIDFTHPSAAEDHIKGALKNGTALVIGTTGLPEKTLQALKQASHKIAILQSPNMSAGVNSLFELASRAAGLLKAYDIEITEIHHNLKKDAPSGTALELARLMAEVRGLDPKKSFLYGRHGETGERKKNSIALHALRGGDIVGEHTVYFFGNGEVIELTHRAASRDAFARGALLAAKFVARKKKGLYNMRDVLQA